MPEDPLSTTFAALADPTRRALLARLAEGEATVGELAEPFAMTLQAISKHLKVLERAGLVVRGKDAQWRPCRLESAPSSGPRSGSKATARSGMTDSISWIDISNSCRPPEGRGQRHDERDRNERRRPSESSTITREYDARGEMVFRAMIEPEQLTHFWDRPARTRRSSRSSSSHGPEAASRPPSSRTAPRPTPASR